MIIREKQLEVLQKAYQTMQQTNRMQLQFIAGEAGSGKTVLANMFMEQQAETDQNTLFISSFCSIRSEYNIPYQPFKELLKNLLHDVKTGDEANNRSSKGEIVRESLKFCGKMLLENAPDLIGNFIPGASILSAIGQAVFKEKEEEKPTSIEESKILEQYVDAIKAIAARYHLVLFIDNLQWIDKLSVNLFYQLIIGLKNYPVMIIGCYRSTDINIPMNGEKHPLNKLITEVKISHGNVFINLDTISQEERIAFMNRMLDRDNNIYDRHFREKLFERTNGNPLFVNELVNLLKEQGMLVRNNDNIWTNNAQLHWNAYPARIEGIIQERIGRLEDSLIEVLSHASIQGYSFIAQVLSKTMGEPERDLLLTLSKTLQKEHRLVYEGDCIRSNKGIVSRFNFSNYIFQQYLYQELSMTQRMMLHSDTANIMEELFKDNLDEVAGDIARHYELSSEYDKAVRYIQITVNNMMRISAYQEASVLTKKAICFLDELPNDEKHLKVRLYFQVQLCTCAQSTKGWGDPEVKDIFQKAKELSEKLNELEYMGIILFGLWSIHLAKLELKECLELARQNMETAKKLQNPAMILSARIALGNTLYWMGDFKGTKKEFTTYLDETANRPLTDETARLNHLFSYMFLLLIAFHEDENELVTNYRKYIKKLCEQTPNHYYKVVGYQALSWHAFLEEDISELKEYAQKLYDQASRYNFHFYLGIGEIFLGTHLLATDCKEGLGTINKGYQRLVDSCKAAPTTTHNICKLSICRHYLKTQQYDHFLKQADEAIRTSTERGETNYLDEMYLLRARYYREIGNPAQAKIAVEQALQISRKHGCVRTEKKITNLFN
ncbi:AAA family ATPase [Bacteroides sp. 51]|uniref:ATP-binding protein n=1 Tax=Bacteroides sp. 51 TaxID=2302938 RepID=UPI0013D56844|nr:AAA family ATPase [Bacteroides sp. 51]NDV84608.1 ATP-binding protein [Bacteroides sp. 51]